MNILITFILNNYILKSRKEKRLYLIPPKGKYIFLININILSYTTTKIYYLIDWVDKLVMVNKVNK